MVYKEDETLKQINTFTHILVCVKILRFIFFSYSALSFIFWFLNCFEVEWLYLFNWLFSGTYWLVSQFYTPQGLSMDFSLAIIGGVFLLIGFCFEFLIGQIYMKLAILQEEEEKKIEKRKILRQKRKTARPITSYAQEDVREPAPFENSKLLFLIFPIIKKIKRKKDDIELTFQEVEIWKQRVNKKLIQNVNYSNPLQKGYYRKNLFLVYNDFNYVDDFVYYISPTLDSLVMEFKKYGISISFCYVLSAISDMKMLEKELDCMDTTLALNFVNEFTTTNRFKVTYDNKTAKKYQLEFKGEYNLSKNLSITNRQPLYTLVDKKKENKE